MGGLVPPKMNRLNECVAAEQKDGTLLINMRAHKVGKRAVSISKDGGLTWSDPQADENLICRTCQASMYGITKSELLFLNPASESRRNLTLRLSTNSGKTWDNSLVLEKGPTGYSDIAIANDKSIYCLFENGSEKYHEKISLVEVLVGVSE